MEHQIDWTALRLTEPDGKERNHFDIRYIHHPRTKNRAQQIHVLTHRLKLVKTAEGWANRSQPLHRNELVSQ